MSLYLGIDVGTQSVKALCYDAQARRTIAVSSAPLALISRDDGSREQHTDWWLQALAQCLSQIDADIRHAVTAIGVSGQQHGFVPLDRDGNVLAPVKLWCDTATDAECRQLTERFGGEQRCIREVGNPLLPGYTASKILWLRNHQPDLYRQLDTILLPHDYINFHLTGEKAMECGDASGTGLLDIRKREWHAGMLHALDPGRDLAACLPPLLAPDATLGRVRTAVAEQLGLRAGTPVSVGGGDNMMAAIGTGNATDGRLTVSLGTSGTLFAHAARPIVDDDGTVAAFCASDGGWLPLLCTMNCTVATELTRQLLQWPLAEIDARVDAVAIGANGVVTLPFFNGERTPNLPAGKGCILGLDAGNYSADNLMRSAMEAAVYGLRAGLDRLRQLGCELRDIRLTGGGARSASWRQMVADVFGLPVTVFSGDEGAALGAALQACWMHERSRRRDASLVELLDEQLVVDSQRCCSPRIDAVDRYDSLYRRYQQHVAAITPLYH